MSISDRLTWAVNVLNVQSADQILEIGCGHGLAAALICDRLIGGHLVALDRSSTMIETAGRRNSACLASGKLTLVCGALDRVDLGHATFDKIFAVNVNVFWMQPHNELQWIKQHLRQDGLLLLAYQPPVASKAEHMIAQLRANLHASGFETKEVLEAELHSGYSFAVSASLR